MGGCRSRSLNGGFFCPLIAARVARSVHMWLTTDIARRLFADHESSGIRLGIVICEASESAALNAIAGLVLVELGHFGPPSDAPQYKARRYMFDDLFVNLTPRRFRYLSASDSVDCRCQLSDDVLQGTNHVDQKGHCVCMDRGITPVDGFALVLAQH